MSIFDKFFGNKAPIVQDPTANIKSVNSNMAFSTAFMPIGKGNLSLPKVNRWYTNQGYVLFGSDNLYPQLLNQLYFTSAIHGDAIDTIVNAVAGGGWIIGRDQTIPVPQQIDIKKFTYKTKMFKLVKNITRDWVIHRRICLVINRDERGKIINVKRLDPSTIRHHVDGKTFLYNIDWSTGLVEYKKYKCFYTYPNEPETLLVYQEDSPGQDIYSIPAYNSILNYAALSGDIAFFMKNNIKNSVFFSAVIRRPKDFSSIDEIDRFKHQIESSKGPEDAGNLLVLTGNGMDDVPEYIPIKANDNDKLFTDTIKIITDEICFAHKINPSIMGVKVQGQLGNAQELQMSYAIFEKNVVRPIREEIEQLINNILQEADIQYDLTFNNYQIIDDELINKSSETAYKETGNKQFVIKSNK
jgi:capsid portal protein